MYYGQVTTTLYRFSHLYYCICSYYIYACLVHCCYYIYTHYLDPPHLKILYKIFFTILLPKLFQLLSFLLVFLPLFFLQDPLFFLLFFLKDSFFLQLLLSLFLLFELCLGHPNRSNTTSISIPALYSFC